MAGRNLHINECFAIYMCQNFIGVHNYIVLEDHNLHAHFKKGGEL